jgi:ABC-type Zn uptake system ZnuABC Zn-binding protein ZnuA
VLVTDHRVLGYFAARYGFRQVGAVVPGFSSLAEPSARELAALEAQVEALDVPAIFVGTTVNPALAERVAADTGAAVVPIYTESLTPPGGPAPSYLELMRYNVAAIVGALGGGEEIGEG